MKNILGNKKVFRSALEGDFVLNASPIKTLNRLFPPLVSISLSLSLPLSLPPSLSHTHTVTDTQSQTHTHTLSLSLYLSLSLSLSLSHTLTNAYTLSLSFIFIFSAAAAAQSILLKIQCSLENYLRRRKRDWNSALGLSGKKITSFYFTFQ